MGKIRLATIRLDKGCAVVSYAGMRSKGIFLAEKVRRVLLRETHGMKRTRRAWMLVPAVASLLVAGCTSGLQKHATALAGATAPVVDGAEKAYQDANAIHDLRVDYDAAVEFDQKDPVYNPRKIKPLLSEKDMDTRLAVLKALQLYVKDVVAVTNGTESKELDEASSSMGSSLAAVGNTFLPAGSSSSTAQITTDGTTVTKTTTVAADAISDGEKNGISAAVNALGQYLGSRKVKKELPPLIIKMDPQIEQLCKFIESDVDVLKSQETIDYNFMINQQTLFLEQNKSMAVEARRALIMQLPGIVRKEQAADEELDGLKAATSKLFMTHHALAAEAQGNNPESLTMKVGELGTAGENLGKFYASLSSDKK